MHPRLTIMVCAASVVMPAAASDAPLQRALSQAACVDARLERLSNHGTTTIYRANCTGSSHRRFIVVCAQGSCRSTPEREQFEE
jgi:hypothetical protein